MTDNKKQMREAIDTLKQIRERVLLEKEADGADVYGKDAPRDYKKEYEEYLDEKYNNKTSAE